MRQSKILTAEEKHRVLLELAFNIYPVEIIKGVPMLAANARVSSEGTRQFLTEADEVYTLDENGYTDTNKPSKYYALTVQKQFDLLREICRQPAQFRNRNLSVMDFTSAVQEFVTDRVITTEGIGQEPEELNILMWMPFFTDFRPFFDAQSAGMKKDCFMWLSQCGYLRDLPKTADLKGAYLENPTIPNKVRLGFLPYVYESQYVYSGRINEVPEVFLKSENPIAHKLLAMKSLYQSRYDLAVMHFSEALNRQKKHRFDDLFYNVAYLLAMKQQGDEAGCRDFEKYGDDTDAREYPLKLIFQYVKGEPLTGYDHTFFTTIITHLDPLNRAVMLILYRHFGLETYENDEMTLDSLIKKPAYRLLQLEASVSTPAYRKQAKELTRSTGLKPMLPAYKAPELWEEVLASLSALDFESEAEAQLEAAPEAMSLCRLVYFVTKEGAVYPVRQKTRNEGRTWSSGKRITLHELYDGVPGMNLMDQKMAALVSRYEFAWGKWHYEWDDAAALDTLTDYPFVFAEDDSKRQVKVTREPFRIVVHRTPAGFVVDDNLGEPLVYSVLNVVMKSPYLAHIVRLTPLLVQLMAQVRQIPCFPLKAEAEVKRLFERVGRCVHVEWV
jgi:hypothetical protein